MNRENEFNRRRFDFILPVRKVNPSFSHEPQLPWLMVHHVLFVALHCKLWTTGMLTGLYHWSVLTVHMEWHKPWPLWLRPVHASHQCKWERDIQQKFIGVDGFQLLVSLEIWASPLPVIKYALYCSYLNAVDIQYLASYTFLFCFTSFPCCVCDDMFPRPTLFIPFSFFIFKSCSSFLLLLLFFHLRVRLYMVESCSDIYLHFPSHNLFLALVSPMQIGLGLFISFFFFFLYIYGADGILMTAWISFSDRPWYVDVQRDIVEGCFDDGKRGGSFCTWVGRLAWTVMGGRKKRCQGWTWIMFFFDSLTRYPKLLGRGLIFQGWEELILTSFMLSIKGEFTKILKKFSRENKKKV